MKLKKQVVPSCKIVYKTNTLISLPNKNTKELTVFNGEKSLGVRGLA